MENIILWTVCAVSLVVIVSVLADLPAQWRLWHEQRRHWQPLKQRHQASSDSGTGIYRRQQGRS